MGAFLQSRICVFDDWHESGFGILCIRSEADLLQAAYALTMQAESLITPEQRAQLLANGHARADDAQTDLWPVVRLFTPDAHAIWLLAALDPADGDTTWGLCDVGIGMPELGSIKLSDLATIVGPQRLPVRRDLHFHAMRPMSEYLRLAQDNGSITD